MAVDTKEKRLSMMNMHALDDTLPEPTGNDLDTVGERQHLLGLYSGISSSTDISIKNLPMMGMG